MNREELETFIFETYAAEPEYLWVKYPTCAVFRHTGNRKWFAALLDAPRKALGLPGEGNLDVLDVKCDPLLIGSFREEPGIYPGYHMNKSCWLSAALDGSADDETIKTLLALSFDLTAPKPGKRKGGPKP